MKKISFQSLVIIGLLIVGGVILPVSVYSSCAPPPPGPFDPNNMVGSGYQLVFDEEFSTLARISFQAPAAVTAGFNFYSSNLRGCGIKPAGQFSINSDGSLHDAGFNGGCGYDLSSIGYGTAGQSNGPAAWQQGWVGHAFGQGFYQEAKLKFATVCDSSTSGFAYPTIWGDTAEFEAGDNLNPGGAPHFVELDQMEWLCTFPNGYFNNSHDWWNNMAGHIQISNNITPAAGTDFTQYHIYGQLWVWGGANGSCATGYRQAYFDGVAVGNKVTWQDCDEITVPPTGTNQGNAIDGGHLSTNIGTGVASHMDTAWVRVWQIPASATASGNTAIGLSDVTVTAFSYNKSTNQFSSTVQNVGSVATPTDPNTLVPAVIGVSYMVDGIAQTYGTNAGPLAAGASVVIGNTGPTYVIPNGNHTITAYVNDVSRFPEANRNNNKLTVSITVP